MDTTTDRQSWLVTEHGTYAIERVLLSYDSMVLLALVRDQDSAAHVANLSDEDETNGMQYVLARVPEAAVPALLRGEFTSGQLRRLILTSPRISRVRWLYDATDERRAQETPVGATDLAEDELPQA